jgi:hypothetical protein
MMYHEHTENILAVFPQGKGFGYAYFTEQYEPDHFGIATVKPPDNAKCLKRVEAMVLTYQPKLILLPTPDGKRNRKKKRVQELLQQITQYAKKNDIQVRTYSREQIRLIFEEFEAHSKLEIAEKICFWMPKLEKYQPPHRKKYMPEDYYQSLFDAISLFITHSYITQ